MKPHLLRKTTNIAHPTWHGRFFAGVGLILLSLASPLLAADDNSGKQSASLSQLNENGGVGGSGSTVLPDLFTGTLGYAVPIEVPPGRNGMAPKLSLSYNSHGTNGWVSYGWSLDLPYIQRQGPHKGLPTYDDTQDTFLFVAGGATIELVPRFIEWGAGYYGAKIEGPFAKFYRDSSTWGWIVTSKNGTAQKFGTTPLSRQNDLTTSLADGTKIYQWYLDTVTDLNSNTMTVTYQKDSFLAGFSSNNVAVGCSQVYPIRINYPPSSSILFDWEGRTDAHFHFRGGLCSGMRQRLKLIEVLNQTQHLRTYQLDYNDFSNTPNQSAFSRLSKITQYDHNASISGSGSTWTVTGNSLPAQTFTYTNKTQSFDASQSWTIAAATDWDGYTQSYATDTIVNSVTITISLPCSPRVQADFNGDGKIDIAYRNRAGGTNDIYVALSTGNGFQTPTQPWGAIPNWDCSKLVGDFNGDGRADVAYRDTDGIYVVYANATGSGFTSPIKLAGVPTGHWDLTRDIGDFNGDGRMDIVYGTSFSGTGSVADVYVVLSAGTGTGSTFGSPSRWNQQLNQPIPGWHTRRLSDFNGDGRTDIGSCAGDSYNCYFYVVLSDGAQFVGYRPALQFSDPVQYNHQIVIGDFNGDGLADILWPNPPNGTCQQNNCLRVYLATGMDGTGFAAMPDIYPPNYTSSTTGKGIVLGDFNGDGLTDIAYESSATADNIYVLLARESDGSPFFDAKSWGIVPTWDAVRTAVGDFNGDGMMDVATRNGSTATITVARSRPLNPDLLASIQNGLGGSTTISYAPSTQYQNSGNLPLVIQTLSSVTVNDGNGTTATSQYTYQGGWFDFTSREFRGFNQVTATDPVGTTTTTWFYQGNPALNESYALKGRPLQTQTADRNGNLYGQTVNTWSTTTPFTNTTFPELIQTNAYVYDGGAFWLKQMKVSTQYDCDLGTPCYGNVVKISNFGEISPQGQVLGPERYQHMEYIQNPSFWIMGLPSHQYTRGPGDAMNLAEAWFYYDGTPSDCSSTSKTAPLTNGNLTLTERWLKNGVNTQGITGYDTYGNPTCSKDPRGTLTAIQYDPTSTFPLVKTVSDGHTTHSHRAITAYYGVNDVATDNGFYGQVKSITDTNNQTATTQYDTFGRKTQTTAPDGGMTTTTYLDWGNPTLQRIRTVAPDGTTDGLWSETYFDGLGRTTTTVTEGPIAGKNISQNVLYNQRGLVAQKSLPYFPGETPRYTSTSYDPIGRPLQAVAPDGASTTTSYAGWQVTTLDPNGHQHRVTNNADGKVIQVDEYGTDTSTPYATTTYQYDGLGNLLKVTDAQNHLTTTSYDTFGRKIGMSDPDMGSCGDVTILQPAAAFPWYPTPCWSYEYDANGNLTRQRDARGQTTSFVYDPLNRVKTKTLADGSQVVYTYDS